MTDDILAAAFEAKRVDALRSRATAILAQLDRLAAASTGMSDELAESLGSAHQSLTQAARLLATLGERFEAESRGDPPAPTGRKLG